MLFWVMYGQRQVNDDYFKNYQYADGTEQSWNRRAWNIQAPAFTHSPYWVQYRDYPTDENRRYFGNAGLTLKLSDAWSIDTRIFSDDYNHLDEQRMAKGFLPGEYQKRTVSNTEINYQTTVSYNQQFDSQISLNGVVGGNILSIKSSQDNGRTSGGLQSEEVYVLQNSVLPAVVSSTFQNKQTNSLFGSLTMGFQEFLYLTVSGRNDWASTLYQTGNYSYFYPSISGSFIFSDLMDSPSVLSFGKLRLAYARVGNDAAPYAVSQYYNYVTSFGSYPLQTTPDFLFNPDLKPELTSEIETGLDLRFFKDRIGLNFTYYNRNTINQIWNINIPSETGYRQKVVNGGEIQNQGIELSLSFDLFQTEHFQWNSRINFSRNRNKVLNLNSTSGEVGGLDRFIIGTERRTLKVSMVAEVGQSLGTMLGTDYVYDANGQQIVGENGVYVVTPTPVVIGDVNPDFVGGFLNTFTVGNLYLSALLDFRKGGDFFSYSNLYGNKSGMFLATAEDGIRENGIVVEGNKEDGTPNDISITAQTHFNANGGNRISKANLYDGSFIYLREVRLGWNLPKALTGKLALEGIRLALTGRNLWLIHSNAPNVDPANITNSIGNQLGFEGGALPPVRTIGINLNVTL